MDARARTTLICVGLATWLLVNGTLPNVALRSITEGVGASFNDLQWLLSGYTLCLAATQLTWGTIADRVGRRRLFLLGLVVFTAGSAACAAARTPLTLILARVTQGIGAAILFPSSLALLAQAFPDAPGRARAIGVRGMVVGAAYGGGSLLGGLAIASMGWQGIFVLSAVTGVVAIALARRGLTESKDPEARPVDLPGVTTLTLGLGLVVLAILRGNPAGWTSAQVVLPALAGVLVLAGFVALERRVAHPMIDLRRFADPAFAGASIVTLLLGAGVIAVLAYVTLFLLVIAGGSPIEVGLWLLPLALVGLAASQTARLTRVLSPATGLAVCTGLAGVGLLALRGTSGDSTWTHFLPGLLIAGAGLGLAQPLSTITHLGVLGAANDGIASGMNNTARQIGVTIGLAGWGALLEHQVRGGLSEIIAPLRERMAGGDLVGALASVPAGERPALRAAYDAAYAGALDDVLLAAAGLVLLAAGVAAVMLRERAATADALDPAMTPA